MQCSGRSRSAGAVAWAKGRHRIAGVLPTHKAAQVMDRWVGCIPQAITSGRLGDRPELGVWKWSAWRCSVKVWASVRGIHNSWSRKKARVQARGP